MFLGGNDRSMLGRGIGDRMRRGLGGRDQNIDLPLGIRLMEGSGGNGGGGELGLGR